MIDIENIVINEIDTAVSAVSAGIKVSGSYVDKPETFPCVTVEQTDSFVYTRSQDEKLTANHINADFEINVYALSKAEAKSLIEVCDEAMQSMKFTRTALLPTPNLDRKIYRYTARYRAVVAAEQNGIYQIYRK